VVGEDDVDVPPARGGEDDRIGGQGVADPPSFAARALVEDLAQRVERVPGGFPPAAALLEVDQVEAAVEEAPLVRELAVRLEAQEAPAAERGGVQLAGSGGEGGVGDDVGAAPVIAHVTFGEMT
jgi:hypothetical protein